MDYFKFPNVIISGGGVICYGDWRPSGRVCKRAGVNRDKAKQAGDRRCQDGAKHRIDYQSETEE